MAPSRGRTRVPETTSTRVSGSAQRSVEPGLVGARRARRGRADRRPAPGAESGARDADSYERWPYRARLTAPMSTHIGAAPGEIAPLVLMPGDPLRATWIAETFLEDATLLLRGARHVRLHRHLARAAGLGAGLRHGPAVAGDLRQRAVPRVRRADDHPGRVLRRADRAAGGPRPGDRVGRLHRLLDEPDRASRASTTRRSPTSGCCGDAARRGRAARRRARRADLQQRLVLPGAARADRADGRARRARGGDGGQRALHAGRAVRPARAGDLHRLRPRRHRRGDHAAGARADASARWSRSPSRPASALPSPAPAPGRRPRTRAA